MKVDAARRRGGIFIVWVAWFIDSLAQWERQDETRYLVDADSSGGGGSVCGKTTPRNPEVSLDEELEEEEGGKELITPDEDIWADATAEVDAFLEETDDEEGADEDGREGDTDGRYAKLFSLLILLNENVWAVMSAMAARNPYEAANVYEARMVPRRVMMTPVPGWQSGKNYLRRVEAHLVSKWAPCLTTWPRTPMEKMRQPRKAGTSEKATRLTKKALALSVSTMRIS